MGSRGTGSPATGSISTSDEIMASLILQDCKLYVAGFDLSSDTNALAMDYAAEMQDATTFGNDTRVNAGGLKTIAFSYEGLWDADGTNEPDDVLFSRVGTQNVPISICPTTGAVGERAFLFRAVHGEYSPEGAVGDMFAYSVTAQGSDGAPLAKGNVLQAAGAVTATGTGTAVAVGATASGQTVYAALHVIAASGTSPTLDVLVQSDVDAAFASPVTVATFSQQTAIGSDWQTAAGPNTDTYFRVSYTVGGTSPSFSFIVTLGIA